MGSGGGYTSVEVFDKHGTSKYKKVIAGGGGGGGAGTCDDKSYGNDLSYDLLEK